MKLNVLWLVILLVSTSVCLSVPDPFKHRMKRVGRVSAAFSALRFDLFSYRANVPILLHSFSPSWVNLSHSPNPGMVMSRPDMAYLP